MSLHYILIFKIPAIVRQVYVTFPCSNFQGVEEENIYSSLASVVGSGFCLSSVVGFPQIRRAFRRWTAKADVYPLQYLPPSSFLVSLPVERFLSHCDAPGTVSGPLKRTKVAFTLTRDEMESEHSGIYITIHSL